MAFTRLLPQKQPLLLLLLLLGSGPGGISVARAQAGEGAFMLVSKSVSFRRVSDAEEEVTVSLSVFNTGTSIAYDLFLNDAVWPANLVDVQGNSTKAWHKLEGGASVSHSFVLKPKHQDVFSPSTATLTFRTPTKPDLQTAFSTPVGPLAFLQPRPKGARWAWLKELAEQYGPLVSAVGIVALVVYVVVVPISSKKSAKKRR